MNPGYEAALAVKQTCEDLVDGYTQLADMGRGLLEKIDSTIGELKQYEVIITVNETGQSNSPQYSDDPMPWYARLGYTISNHSVSERLVDHPEQWKAERALEETLGIVGGADEKYGLDSGDLRDSVSSLADHMSGWVRASEQASSLVFASSAKQIRTSGDIDGWRSQSAQSTYEDNVRVQHSTHDSLARSIESLLSKDGDFLSSMGDHLDQFTLLTAQQTDYYTGLADLSWVPTDWNIVSIVGIIDEVGGKVAGYQELQVQEIRALSSTLNDAVRSILNVEEQKNAISRLSEPTGTGEPGWPMPAQLSGKKGDGDSTFTDLKFQTQYFKDHISHWADLADDFSAPIDAAASTPAIQTMFHQLPGFMATTASALNSLADHIVEAGLRRGQKATREMSEILDVTIRNYLNGEDLNTQEAAELEKLLDE